MVKISCRFARKPALRAIPLGISRTVPENLVTYHLNLLVSAPAVCCPQNNMAKLFITIIPYLVVFSHALLLLVFVAVLTRKFWGKGIYIFIGKNVLLLGFLITLGAMVGSLFYSEIIGYEACVLCWWQRIFLYPQMFIFTLALYRKDRSIFPYITSLTLLALLVALYQTYYDFGGKSL